MLSIIDDQTAAGGAPCRCGKVQMVNEAHARWRDRRLRDILARMRHDGCGGLAGKAGLLTGIEGVSSKPVRKMVLREGRNGAASS